VIVRYVPHGKKVQPWVLIDSGQPQGLQPPPHDASAVDGAFACCASCRAMPKDRLCPGCPRRGAEPDPIGTASAGPGCEPIPIYPDEREQEQ
jgi:hypothetical protein